MDNDNFIFFKDNVPMVGKINNIQYEYLWKEASCKGCDNIVYNPDVMEYNAEALYDKCREVNGLISLQKISEIPQKYDIDNISLSLLLGWGENTSSKFYEGNARASFAKIATSACRVVPLSSKKTADAEAILNFWHTRFFLIYHYTASISTTRQQSRTQSQS